MGGALFHPKDGTPGCTIEAHNFQRDQPQYAQRNAVVVGVSVDTTDSHKEFCSKEGLNFKTGRDAVAWAREGVERGAGRSC